ncbi:hypothetical protein [Qipengyuania thermophila]|uniref:hypothetical protein n=1 Tax=Qipengyuania thermophila TaxID=2509361 RepID=UPI0013EDA382|nr:hypothetical protein [Qipengyuania thermophila]
MIAARTTAAALTARLRQDAARLARAATAARRLARDGDGRHWRTPRLVWPLFTKG